MVPRNYNLKRRAEQQGATRRRIVEATIHLHETAGSNGATITAIAKTAGVSRLTVYRHFPDQVSLLQACTGLYNRDHPPPDASGLAAIQDPVRRLELALEGLYAYFAANEPMLGSGADALPTHPALAIALEPYFDGMRRMVELLSVGWEVDSGRGSLLGAALGHAIGFPTWRALRQEQGVTQSQAVRLMVGMVLAARDATLAQRATGAKRTDESGA